MADKTTIDSQRQRIIDHHMVQKLTDDVRKRIRLIDDSNQTNNEQQQPNQGSPSSSSIVSSHNTRKSYYHCNSIMNQPVVHPQSTSTNLGVFSHNKIRIGIDYQAQIDSSILEQKPFNNDHNNDGVDHYSKSLLLWKPQSNIDDDELREFIDLAKEVANMNEEQALGFLTALDFQLKECTQILSQMSFAPQPMDYAERAHIERFIFTEHKLDMIKIMINDDDIVNKLFYLYYTKQNRPPSVSEVLMINREEDTTIFDLINDQIECNRNVDNNNCLDLATIIGECYQQKTENPKFDITRLECFQERREQINELRRQTQQLQQRNLIETCKLRKNSMDYLKFLHFLKKCKSNSKWNIYEVIILLAIMDFIRPKFDAFIFSKILQTKTPEQCQRFYQKHFAFLKQASTITVPNDRIEAIRMYMQLPELQHTALLSRPAAAAQNMSRMKSNSLFKKITDKYQV
ncbi:REST corepressor 3 [Dermatophagoides farinae]|uniref:Golgi snap receptor complex member 2-like protein n=1 Tax=Dermatophagoides farinae TaxID=6954 RepID=A0A922HV28_DERFA|nr:golgi snap receptor complex member 2-like protein [Dermatophagoides farinae]KAH9507004.1 REST corepressor 3 [Dermatophagoides farinae]